MATGINEGYESLHDMVDGEDANAHLTSRIPDYDEDLDEAFVGPYGSEVDESYEDLYEAESTRLIEGQESLALESSRGGVSADTQSWRICLGTSLVGMASGCGADSCSFCMTCSCCACLFISLTM